MEQWFEPVARCQFLLSRCIYTCAHAHVCKLTNSQLNSPYTDEYKVIIIWSPEEPIRNMRLNGKIWILTLDWKNKRNSILLFFFFIFIFRLKLNFSAQILRNKKTLGANNAFSDNRSITFSNFVSAFFVSAHSVHSHANIMLRQFKRFEPDTRIYLTVEMPRINEETQGEVEEE